MYTSVRSAPAPRDRFEPTFLARHVLFGLFLLAGWEIAVAQTPCPCQHWVSQSGIYRADNLGIQPGQTICIQAGQYTQLRFINFAGSAQAPIRFINYGGQVVVTGDAYNVGIQFYGCRYFRLTGTGDERYPYGFRIDNTGKAAGSALNVSVKSTDCELDHVEVSNAGFAGIMVKTDPDCDSTAYRGNFTMYNVRIHDTYVHDTGGEGMYIGNSFWSGGVTRTCNGVVRRVYPHEIHGLEVYDNRVERTGCEGIQYGCSPGAKVHHNTINTTGTNPFANFQNNGIQMGEGSSGECYNNYLTNAPGSGLVMIGNYGPMKAYNNVLTNIGVDGVFVDDRPGSLQGPAMELLNNTIVNCGRDAVRLYNQNNVNTIANNVLAKVKGKYVVFQQGATATQKTNAQTARPDTLGFVDAAENFLLKATSKLIKAGTNLSERGVTFDLLDQPRPASGNFDVGAYQFSTTPPPTPPKNVPPTLWGNCGLLTALVPDIAGPPVLTGLEEPAAATTVYPSPGGESVTFRVPGGARRVALYDLSGRMVAQCEGPGLPDEVTLATANLPNGLYVYRIEAAAQTTTGKWVKH
jgi:hypothetical protein